MPQRLEEYRLRLEAVELLRLLRRAGMSYQELEEATGVPRSSLAQYVTGQRLPSTGQAMTILEALLSRSPPVKLIASRLERLDSVSDLGDAVLDPLILRYASLWAAYRFRGRIDTVLSAETYGVPLAAAIAMALDARLVIARRAPGGSRAYIKAEGGEPPLGVKTLYIPSDMVPAGSRVLLVDDLARTGATLEALARGVREAGAAAAAALVVLALGREWRSRLERLGVADVYALLELGLG